MTAIEIYRKAIRYKVHWLLGIGAAIAGYALLLAPTVHGMGY